MQIELPQLEMLGAALADGLVVGTPDGTVLSASPRACAMLGLPPDAPPADVAQVLAESLHPIDEALLPPVEPPLRRAAQAMFDHEDVRCDGADGCARRLRLAGMRLAEAAGGRPVVVVIVRELPPPPPISEPPELDSEIRRLRQLRDEILSIASHELRNPLTVILGYSAVLAGAQSVRAEPRLARAAAAVRQQSQRMRRLVDQLLDFSRLGLGQLTLQRAAFDLAEQVRLAAAHAAPTSAPLPASLPAEPLTVHGDAMRIARVLATLLADALRRAPEPGAVQVAVRRAEAHEFPADAYGGPARPGPYALVRVRDPGLPPTANNQLFARYTPIGDWDTPQADHWLGLYVGAQVLLLHGGLIWAEHHPVGAIAYALPLVS